MLEDFYLPHNRAIRHIDIGDPLPEPPEPISEFQREIIPNPTGERGDIGLIAQAAQTPRFIDDDTSALEREQFIAQELRIAAPGRGRGDVSMNVPIGATRRPSM